MHRSCARGGQRSVRLTSARVLKAPADLVSAFATSAEPTFLGWKLKNISSTSESSPRPAGRPAGRRRAENIEHTFSPIGRLKDRIPGLTAHISIPKSPTNIKSFRQSLAAQHAEKAAALTKTKSLQGRLRALPVDDIEKLLKLALTQQKLATKDEYEHSRISVKTLFSALVFRITKSDLDLWTTQPTRSISTVKDPIALSQVLRARKLILEDARTVYGIRPSAFDYHNLVVAQISRGALTDAQATIRSALAGGEKPLQDTLNFFAIACARERNWKAARWARETSLLAVRWTADPVLANLGALVAFVVTHANDLDATVANKFLQKHCLNDLDHLRSLLSRYEAGPPPAIKLVLQELLSILPVKCLKPGISPALDVYRLQHAFRCSTPEDRSNLMRRCNPFRDTFVLERLGRGGDPNELLSPMDPELKEHARQARFTNRQNPDTEQLAASIDRALRLDPPALQEAYSRFRDAVRVSYILPTTLIKDLIVRHLTAGRYKQAKHVYDTAVQWEQQLPTETIEYLIQNALEANDWEGVRNVYSTLTELATPTARICAFILNGIRKTTHSNPAQWLMQVSTTFARMVDKEGVVPDVRMVNMLANAYAASGDAPSILWTLNRWKDILEPDAYTTHALVKAHLTAGARDKAVEVLEGLVKDLKPLQSTINMIVASAPNVAEGDALAERAETIWGVTRNLSTEQAIKHITGPGSKTPDVGHFTKIIGSHLEKGETAQADAVFESMIKQGVKPNAITYHVFIHHYAKLEDMSRADSYLTRMGDMIPLVKTYASLIAGHAAAGDVWAAERVVESMRCPPDTGIMNAAMDVRAREGDVEAVRRIRRAMVRKYGLKVNSITYNILLKAYARDHSPASLRAALHILRTLEAHPDPDLRVYEHTPYTTVIAGFGRAGDANGALRRWDEMEKACVPPALATWNAMIGALCNAGRLDDAKAWFQKGFVGTDLAPDAVTFATLIKGHAERNDEAGIRDWAHLMGKAGMQPSSTVHNHLLEWLSRTADDSVVLQWYTSARVKPTSSALVAVLRGLVGRSAPDATAAAERWVERMSEVSMDVKAWTSLAQCYGRSRDLDGMRNVLVRMSERGVTPNAVTFLAVLDAAAKMRDADAAWSILDQMRKALVPVRTTHIVALMDANCRAGRLEDVERCWQWIVDGIWEGMEKSESKTKSGTAVIPASAASVYLDALGLLSSRKQVQDAWRFLKDRKDHFVDENQMCSYVEAVLRHGDVEAAVNAIIKFRSGGGTLSAKTFRSLIGGVMAAAGEDESRKVVETIRRVVGQENHTSLEQAVREVLREKIK
ncbi:hypothetical protein HKX48_008376 [Thoreauomyces humboldtii]|nr:hypothetical protein HKX48_008376 [Thoreauomyces humboldtii]